MTRSRDLLGLLRDVDERLATLAPSPELLARLRRAPAPTRPGLGRPLLLMAAVGASVIALTTALRPPSFTVPSTDARGTTAEPIVEDRARADGGSPESAAAVRNRTVERRILAPLLREPRLLIGPPPIAPAPAPRRRFDPSPDGSPLPMLQLNEEVISDHPLGPTLELTPVPVPGRLLGPGITPPKSVMASAKGPAGSPAPSDVAASPESNGAHAAPPPSSPPVDPNQSQSGSPSEGTCESLDVLKKEADAQCAAEGGFLSDFQGLDPCGPNSYLHATHTCSKPIADGGACFKNEIGDGTYCQDITALQDQASAKCAAQGALFTELGYDVNQSDCSDLQLSKAMYTCCPTPMAKPPYPPAMLCGWMMIGKWPACQSVDTLKVQAIAMCTKAGAQTRDLVFSESKDPSCPGGVSTAASFSCCVP